MRYLAAIQISFILGIMCNLGCHSRKSNQKPDRVVTGTTVTLHSNILNEEREIWINIPDKNISPSLTDCPVLYLLDAEEHFNSLIQKIRKLKIKYEKY